MRAPCTGCGRVTRATKSTCATCKRSALLASLKRRCRHCQGGPVNRPRGLCWNCYYSAARELYQSESNLGRRTDGANINRSVMPDSPTSHKPGSPEKVAVLEARAAAGEALFHPADGQHEA